MRLPGSRLSSMARSARFQPTARMELMGAGLPDE